MTTKVCSIEPVSPTVLAGTLKPEFDGVLSDVDEVEIELDPHKTLRFSRRGHTLTAEEAGGAAVHLGNRLLISKLGVIVIKVRLFKHIAYCDLSREATDDPNLRLAFTRALYAGWRLNRPPTPNRQFRSALLEQRSAWGVR